MVHVCCHVSSDIILVFFFTTLTFCLVNATLDGDSWWRSEHVWTLSTTFLTGPHLLAPAACQAVPPTRSATAVRIVWLASHGLARLAGKQWGSAVSRPWRPAKVSLFKLASGHHERRRRSDIFCGGRGGISRVVSTGWLAHSAEIWLQTDRHPPTHTGAFVSDLSRQHVVPPED